MKMLAQRSEDAQSAAISEAGRSDLTPIAPADAACIFAAIIQAYPPAVEAQAEGAPAQQQQAAPIEASSLPSAQSVDEDLMAALFPWMPPESPAGQVDTASPAASLAAPLPKAAPAAAAPMQLVQLPLPPLPPAAASAAAPQLQPPPAPQASAPAAASPTMQQRQQQQPAEGVAEDAHEAASAWPKLGASLQAPKRKAAPAPKPKPLPVGDTAEAASSRSSARAAASVAEMFASFVPPRLQAAAERRASRQGAGSRPSSGAGNDASGAADDAVAAAAPWLADAGEPLPDFPPLGAAMPKRGGKSPRQSPRWADMVEEEVQLEQSNAFAALQGSVDGADGDHGGASGDAARSPAASGTKRSPCKSRRPGGSPRAAVNWDDLELPGMDVHGNYDSDSGSDNSVTQLPEELIAPIHKKKIRHRKIWTEAQRRRGPHQEGAPISIPQIAEEMRMTRRLAGRETIAGKIMRDLWNERWPQQAGAGPGKRSIVWNGAPMTVNAYYSVDRDLMQRAVREACSRRLA